MFKALFEIILNLVASTIQVIMWPLNQVVASAFPDFSSKIIEITSMFASVFNAIGWGLGLLPPSVVATLLFVVAMEIIKNNVYISSHMLVKIWNLVQRIKFW